MAHGCTCASRTEPTMRSMACDRIYALRRARRCRCWSPAPAQASARDPLAVQPRPPTAATRRRAGSGAARMERRIRRVRPSADDGGRDPRRRRAISAFALRVCGRWPRSAAFRARPSTQHTAGLTPDLRIMDLLDSQPEFTKSLWDYLDILVTEARIEKGRASWRSTGRSSTRSRKPMASTATSSRRSGASNRSTARRSASARSSARPRRSPVSAAGRITSARNSSRRWKSCIAATCSPDHLMGSWAGAFGPTQFMPTSFKRYAVDFDRDGRRDVVDSMPDMLGSTANNLKKDGWAARPDLGLRSRGAAELQFSARRPLTCADAWREWEQRGIRRPNGKPFPRTNDRAYLLVPAGRAGPGLPDAATISASS